MTIENAIQFLEITNYLSDLLTMILIAPKKTAFPLRDHPAGIGQADEWRWCVVA
jgi:hypothetical protein